MNPGILTQTLNNFLAAFGSGWSNLQPAINWLTGALLSIEIVMLGLWWALGGGEQLVAVMKKILYLGIWMWIVRSFPTLADAFVKSLIQAGQLAGGGGGPSLFDPSKIIEYGLTTTAPLVEKISNVGITEIVNGIVLAITYIGIMLAYILIAWQIFYAVLEFNLMAAVVGILLPFGFVEQTKFLAEKAIGAIVSSGIKLMVLAFIMAVIEPTPLDGWRCGVPCLECARHCRWAARRESEPHRRYSGTECHRRRNRRCACGHGSLQHDQNGRRGRWKAWFRHASDRFKRFGRQCRRFVSRFRRSCRNGRLFESGGLTESGSLSWQDDRERFWIKQ